MKRALVSLGALAILVAGFFTFGPTLFDRAANRVLDEPPYEASAQATKLFEDSFVVDLHADSLLWKRDLGRRLEYGAVDIPRLIEGNVAIQSFFIVTKSPWQQTIDSSPADSDAITTLIVAQRWPRRTWGSLLERALYQSARLHDLATRFEGEMVILKTKTDLRLYREARATGRAMTAGILGVEGAHVLEGDLHNLAKLFEAGVRIVAPTHFFDNAVGGSAHGLDKGGLTDLGRELVRQMESRGMLLDLAHASEAVFEDAIALSTRPVIVSHTGVRATCDNNRNLTDAQLTSVAATGGVIGIGYWDTAVCGEDADAIARAIVHAIDVVGPEHVALGSDFDGAVPVPFDTTGLSLIVEALIDRDMSDADVRAVIGQNAARVLEQTLPD